MPLFASLFPFQRAPSERLFVLGTGHSIDCKRLEVRELFAAALHDFFIAPPSKQ